jgi:hypothetical protein
MPTKLAQKMVFEESIIGFTEAFSKGMKQRADYILENLTRDFAKRILFDRLNEDYETKLDNAIDHVISCMNEQGLDNLSETIENISPLYGINPADVTAIFESALEDETPINENKFNKLQNHLLNQLNNILEENSGNIVSFADATSVYVMPEESNALVEVYSQLNADNKQKMVDKMVTSKSSFNNVLKFATQTLSEENRGG